MISKSLSDPGLVIIIVNYNTRNLLKDCLNSVNRSLRETGLASKTTIVVVDNGSSDGSVSMLKKEFPEVFCMKNRKNAGFAQANNQALDRFSGKVALLLNSDTRVDRESIDTAYRYLRSHPDTGVVGVTLRNPDRTLQPSAGFFPTISRVAFWMAMGDDCPGVSRVFRSYHVQHPGFYQTLQDPDWVTGAFFMINSTVTQRSGKLDSRIFMYGEEVEWCYRIKQSGFRVVFLPTSGVIHVKGASSSSSAGIREEFAFIEYFYRKYHPRLTGAVKILLWFGALVRYAVFGIIGTYPDRRKEYEKIIGLAG